MSDLEGVYKKPKINKVLIIVLIAIVVAVVLILLIPRAETPTETGEIDPIDEPTEELTDTEINDLEQELHEDFSIDEDDEFLDSEDFFE